MFKVCPDVSLINFFFYRCLRSRVIKPEFYALSANIENERKLLTQLINYRPAVKIGVAALVLADGFCCERIRWLSQRGPLTISYVSIIKMEKG